MKGTYVLWLFLCSVGTIVAGLLAIVFYKEPPRHLHSYKRLWILGGEFKITNTNITNIGILPEAAGVQPTSEIEALKGGWIMDGAVFDTFVDTCFHLYIVGNFSNYYDANDYTVKPTHGPIIMYNIKNESFVPIPGASNITGSMKTVSVDCLSIPASIERCSCLVYVGGQFIFNSSTGINGTNVMRYHTAEQYWDSMPGHDIINGSVNVVRRQNYGVEINPDRVFVGGTFEGGILMFNIHTLNWTSLPSQYTLTGDVMDIFYHPKATNMYVFFGGNFSIEENGNIICQFLCKYHFVEEVIYNFSSPITHPVYSIDGDINRLYVGGLESNVSLISLQKELNPKWDQLGTNQSLPIGSLTLCRVTDLGCERGSVFVSSPHTKSLHYYYSGETFRSTVGPSWQSESSWLDFSSALNGTVNAISSKFLFY